MRAREHKRVVHRHTKLHVPKVTRAVMVALLARRATVQASNPWHALTCWKQNFNPYIQIIEVNQSTFGECGHLRRHCASERLVRNWQQKGKRGCVQSIHKAVLMELTRPLDRPVELCVIIFTLAASTS